MPRRLLPLVLAALAILTAGCSSIGPGSISRDRFDYNAALTESWKRQILLNVVKMRYVDPVSFVDVGQIVAGYTVETGVSAGFSRQVFDFDPNHANVGKLDLGVTGKFTDRPTITYTPMTGTPFLKGVMSPVPPINVLMNMQSGVSAEFLCKLGVASINGLRNETIAASGYRPPDPKFVRVVELLGALQTSGGLRVKAERASPRADPVVSVGFGGRNLPAEVGENARELKTLLGLDPAVDLYALVAAPSAENDRQIAMQTYSLMHILAGVSLRVDVPEADIAAHRALPGVRELLPPESQMIPAVKCGDSRPDEAFVAVNYRGRWFYVDDTNLAAKRVFNFILLAFTLIDNAKPDSMLQLTLPAQ